MHEILKVKPFPVSYRASQQGLCSEASLAPSRTHSLSRHLECLSPCSDRPGQPPQKPGCSKLKTFLLNFHRTHWSPAPGNRAALLPPPLSSAVSRAHSSSLPGMLVFLLRPCLLFAQNTFPHCLCVLAPIPISSLYQPVFCH